MKVILAIDPGPVQSAWVTWDGSSIFSKGIEINNSVLRICNGTTWVANVDVLAVEQIKSYGMAVSDSIFDTVFWTGRFIQAWEPGKWERVPRMTVKMHLCHMAKAKDSNIRQALIDRFGEPGKKANPGILYGLKKDLWAAFALAVTYFDQKGDQK